VPDLPWAAYARVSSRHQAESGLGLDDQRRKLEAWGVLHGHRLEFFVDEAETGKDMNRPELQRALDGVTAGRFAGLVVVKLDRMTRSVRDLMDLLDMFKDEGGPNLASVTESFDTGTATGRFFVGMMGLIAQWERETISERTKAALAVKRSRGEFTGGGVPYGYRNVDGVLEVDMAERFVAEEAARLYTSQQSYRKVGAKLQASGLRPRTGSWHPEKAKAAVIAGRKFLGGD
jgi:site-specific DNA recombinase